MSIHSIVLWLHILGGSVALLVLPVVLIAPKRRGPHTAAGLAFVAGMGLAVGSSFPLAVLTQSPFLAGVGLFSAYLIASGWRWIRRPGLGTSRSWGLGLAWGMLAACLPLIAVGVRQLAGGDSLGAVLLAFAAIGGSLAAEDLIALRSRTTGKRRRTMLHLGRLLGAAIATVTAVLVVNVDLEPAWLVWLAPTMIGTPAIAIWSTRVARQQESASATAGSR
jgi:hypothetical protein